MPFSDELRLAQYLEKITTDPNEFIGTARAVNQDGTVNVVRPDGTSVNAIAASPGVSGQAFCCQVDGKWYVWRSGQSQVQQERVLLARRSRGQTISRNSIYIAFAIVKETTVEFWVISLFSNGVRAAIKKNVTVPRNEARASGAEWWTRSYVDISVVDKNGTSDLGVLYSYGTIPNILGNNEPEGVRYYHNQALTTIDIQIRDNNTSNANIPRLVNSNYVGLVNGFGGLRNYLRYTYVMEDNSSSHTAHYIHNNAATTAELPVTEELSDSFESYFRTHLTDIFATSLAALPSPDANDYTSSLIPGVDQYLTAAVSPSIYGTNTYDIYVSGDTPSGWVWSYVGSKNAKNTELIINSRWRKAPHFFNDLPNGTPRLKYYTVNHQLELLPGLVVTNSISETLSVSGIRISEETVFGSYGGYIGGIPSLTILGDIESQGVG